MSDVTPTREQAAVIEQSDGIVVVDAGAGTGKTFTITQRYARLIASGDIDPDDVLLVTFTRNAANEARERIVAATSDTDTPSLRQAPIGTFHGLCHELLLSHGFDAPAVMGLNERITDSTQLIDDPVVEGDRFRSFYRQFLNRHPEHHEIANVVRNPDAILALIKQLAAKGVFPTASGWYRDGDSILRGDFASYESLFRQANKPNEGATGPTNSDLKRNLSSYDMNRCFLPGAPTKDEVRGEPAEKSIANEWAEEAFDEDRSALFGFVHDVYFEYVHYALRRNYLNFSFLQMFAFMLLCENSAIREEAQYSYVIVDEFQDTSELQFKLTLLLTGDGNLCVVGDWKQSIYGFQYAAVENIRSFESRIVEFADQLNDTVERVTYPVDVVTRISLTNNFRSTQPILDLAERSLRFPARVSDDPNIELDADVISLDSVVTNDRSQQRAVSAVEQVDAVIDTIQSIVGNAEYGVRTDRDTIRPPDYGDIAVLTRNRSFGRELRSRAMALGTPAAFEGGVELFRTTPGILVLAWLRIIAASENRRGWAVILEKAGYPLDQIREILDANAYPIAFRRFAEQLSAIADHAAKCRAILEQYGHNGAYAETIVTVIENIHLQTDRTLPGIIRYIETCIERSVTHEVADSIATDSVTIQTIHGAKGLEYPIVILADVSQHSFPSTQTNRAPLRFADPIGLRSVKQIDSVDQNEYRFDSWRYQLLSAPLRGDYDEERRLLYVALTRAKDHIIISAGEKPSPFFDALPLSPTELQPDPTQLRPSDPSTEHLHVSIPETDDPVQLAAHDLIDQGVFDSVEGGRGTVFGTKIHSIAEDIIAGIDTGSAESPDERRLREFLNTLSGDRTAELPVTLPCYIGDVPVTITGTIDLLHELDDTIQIIDYKTDTTKRAKAEYRKQLSVYYHAVDAIFDVGSVELFLYFTADGELNEVLPLTWDELLEVTRQELVTRP